MRLIGHLITDSDFPNFHAYHCIIHQQTLCSNIQHEELDLVKKAVVKIVNFVRANAFNHRQFRALLSEYESNYTNLILHTDVRWLSRGKVLTRMNNVIEELKVFLREKCKDDLLVHPESPVFLCRLAFLADITHHLNTLNLKLQGRHKMLPTLMNEIDVLKAKLGLFAGQLRHFMHFPELSKTAEIHPNVVQAEKFESYVENLKSDFSTRFKDIRPLNSLFRFVENPFASESDPVDIPSSMKLLVGDEAALQLEIINLQHNNALKSMHKDSPESTPTNFWMKYVDVNDFPEMSKCCKKILTCLGVLTFCEAGFPALTNIKSKKRNALTDQHLEDLLRAAVTQCEPEIKQVAAALQSQPSH